MTRSGYSPGSAAAISEPPRPSGRSSRRASRWSTTRSITNISIRRLLLRRAHPGSHRISLMGVAYVVGARRRLPEAARRPGADLAPGFFPRSRPWSCRSSSCAGFQGSPRQRHDRITYAVRRRVVYQQLKTGELDHLGGRRDLDRDCGARSSPRPTCSVRCVPVDAVAGDDDDVFHLARTWAILLMANVGTRPRVCMNPPRS